MPIILCLDGEPALAVALEQALEQLGHRPLLATSLDEALVTLERETVDLVVADERVQGATAFDLLERLRELAIDVPVMVTSRHGTIEQAVRAVRHGAVDYLALPLRGESLGVAVEQALERARLEREGLGAPRVAAGGRAARAIVGKSRVLRRVLETLATVAPTRATVLLAGESGTGKELFSRALHEKSPRRNQPLVVVNCAAMPEGLV